MNANDLWAGFEYAYFQDRPKGQEAPAAARRVKVIKVFKKQLPQNKRLSAFAIVQFLDEAPGYWGWSSNYIQGNEYEVRARDIVDHWEDYEHTREEIEAEAEERKRERIEAAAKREEERLERERIKREKSERFLTAFVGYTGIPREMVDYTYGTFTIKANDRLKSLLGVVDE